jgi:NAD(P)H dehydrogenase (quinone)
VLLGQQVVYHHRSPDQQLATMLADGVPPMVANLLVGLDQVFRESVLGETTSTVEALTGKSPRTIQAWLAENIDLFRSPQPAEVA